MAFGISIPSFVLIANQNLNEYSPFSYTCKEHIIMCDAFGSFTFEFKFIWLWNILFNRFV